MGEVHGEGVKSGSDIFIDNQHNFKQGRMSGLRGADVRVHQVVLPSHRICYVEVES